MPKPFRKGICSSCGKGPKTIPYRNHNKPGQNICYDCYKKLRKSKRKIRVDFCSSCGRGPKLLPYRYPTKPGRYICSACYNKEKGKHGICSSCGEGPKRIANLHPVSGEHICTSCYEQLMRSIGDSQRHTSVPVGQESKPVPDLHLKSQGTRSRAKRGEDFCSFCDNGPTPTPYTHKVSGKRICEVCYMRLERFGLHVFFLRPETPKLDSIPLTLQKAQATPVPATTRVKPAAEIPRREEKGRESPRDLPITKARREEPAAEVPSQDPEDCPHYWVIEAPSGPTSMGTCNLCGATKEFRNSMPSRGWAMGKPPKEEEEALVT